MPFDSHAAVHHLQALERQLAEAPRHDHVLRVLWTHADRQARRRAIARAERHVRAMAITTGHLTARVVSADGLGALDSLSELALRAARLVVLTELDALGAIVRAVPDGAPSRPLSWGRFWGLADLTACVVSELDRILDPCRTLRGKAQSNGPTYRTGLREAHAALRRLGTASEFARFLWEGRDRTDRPALQALCARISIALTVRIDADPDEPLAVCGSAREDRATERVS